MMKTNETKQAELAIRELSAEELKQAGGAGIIMHDRTGVIVHD